MPDGPEVSLLLAGDVHLGAGRFELDDDLRALAGSADLVSFNLETPLTDAAAPGGEKAVHLKSEPAALQRLRDLSVDVVTLANNHICDWGRQGLVQTLELLGGHGIAAVGAGIGKAEAEASVVVSRNDTNCSKVATWSA